MRVLRLRKKVTLINKESYDIYTIRLRTIDYFKLYHYQTNEIDGIIKFKLVNFIISSGNQGYGWAFNILREGNIEFVKQPEKFQVSWEVKLDTLYFQDICISLLAGIFTYLLFDKGIITSIAVSIAFFFVFLFFGIVYIKKKLEGIIFKSTFLKFY
jgi:hypothetical protein